MNKTLLIFIFGFMYCSANAQADLAPDQNPRYRESMEKYINIKDSLQVTNNTTVQQTYKAYDWYEAKMEAKKERQQFRRQLRLNRSYYRYNPYTYYDDPYRYHWQGRNSRYGSGNMPWYFWIW